MTRRGSGLSLRGAGPPGSGQRAYRVASTLSLSELRLSHDDVSLGVIFGALWHTKALRDGMDAIRRQVTQPADDRGSGAVVTAELVADADDHDRAFVGGREAGS